MTIIKDVFLLLGAIAVFLLGLKTMSEGVMGLADNKLNKFIRSVSSTKAGAITAGVVTTAVMQSSVATNMVVITFVESGVLTFTSAAAVIMGTNIGTTVTAQLVSFSLIGDFDISAFGGIMCFIGFLLTMSEKKKTNALGTFFMGFGLVFTGLMLMTESVEYFKNYRWFSNLFTVKNPILLFLNGIIITSIVQSSSVFTSMLVLLGAVGLVTFEDAAFLILGSNIGTCVAVIIASLKMGAQAKKTAIFNLVFNLFGSALFFVPLLLWGDKIGRAICATSGSISRQTANFHTLFNTVVCLVILPVLKPFCALVEKIYALLYTDKSPRSLKIRAKQHT